MPHEVATRGMASDAACGLTLASRFYIYVPIQSNRHAVRVGASRRRPIASGVYLSDKRPRHRPRGAIGYLPRYRPTPLAGAFVSHTAPRRGVLWFPARGATRAAA